MSRKRLNDEMSKFYDWMLSSGFTPATAKVYSSSCRALQRHLGDQFLDEVDRKAHLDQIKEKHPKVYSTHVSAFNCFTRFVQANGQPLEQTRTLDGKTHRDAKEKYPVTVVLAIQVIENFNKKAQNKISISY